MNNLTTSETLNLAADLIEERGWASGFEGMSIAGPHCLEGAIQAATGAVPAEDDPDEYPYLHTAPCAAGDAVRSYLALKPKVDLYWWNDATGRTATQVIEVLRAAALVESARETAGLPGLGLPGLGLPGAEVPA